MRYAAHRSLIAITVSLFVAAHARADTPLEVQRARVADLEATDTRLQQEMRDIGGGRTPQESINNVEARKSELQERDQRLEEAVQAANATKAELDQLREQAANQTVIGLDDLAQETGEQAAEKAAARALSKGAGRTLGIGMLVVDVIEYGGKYYIRWDTTRTIKATGRQQQAQLIDLLKLQIATRNEITAQIRKLDRLKALREQSRRNFAELAKERERLRLMSEPATRHARTGRETDTAGDKALQDEANRDGIRLSNPESAPPRRRGVWSSSNQQSMAPVTPGETYVSAAPALTFGTWEGPRPVYLGFENALLVQRFHVEDIETDDTFTGVDFHVAAHLSERLALHVGVNSYDISFSGSRDTIDPLGQDLLFPGVTSAGYALGAGVPEGTPGGFNVVDRLSYNYRADNTTLYAALAHAYDCGPVHLIGYGGIAHTFGDQRQRLDGRIPGYGFDFAYDTEFRTEITRGMIGGRATTAPFAGTPQFRVNAGLTAFLNFADAEGVDALQLGPIFEQIDLGQNEITFGWAAGVGAEWEIGATTFFANYRYVDDDVVPVAVREDNATISHAEFERAQAHVGMLGARFSF